MYYVEWQDNDCSDECFPYSSNAFYSIEEARRWRDGINPTGLITRIIFYDASTNAYEIEEED